MKTKVFQIFGDKSRKSEPSEHRMEFPGGSISVARTTNGEYWAHVEINDKQVLAECHREAKLGELVDLRLDYNYDHFKRTGVNVLSKENLGGLLNGLNHLAVRIKTK